MMPRPMQSGQENTYIQKQNGSMQAGGLESEHSPRRAMILMTMRTIIEHGNK